MSNRQRLVVVGYDELFPIGRKEFEGKVLLALAIQHSRRAQEYSVECGNQFQIDWSRPVLGVVAMS